MLSPGVINFRTPFTSLGKIYGTVPEAWWEAAGLQGCFYIRGEETIAKLETLCSDASKAMAEDQLSSCQIGALPNLFCVNFHYCFRFRTQRLKGLMHFLSIIYVMGN